MSPNLLNIFRFQKKLDLQLVRQVINFHLYALI
jgi:hypothetical protein